MKLFSICFLVHFVVFMVLFLLGLDFSGVDGEEPGLVSQVAGALSQVLGQPGLFLADFLPTPIPDALEWAILIGNSVLWAVCLSAAVRRFRS